MPIDKYLPFFNGKSFKSQENIDTFLQLYDATTIYAQIGFGGSEKWREITVSALAVFDLESSARLIGNFGYFFFLLNVEQPWPVVNDKDLVL